MNSKPFVIKPIEPIKITLKPMLFMGSFFYPEGGWDDFVGFFETVNEARRYALEDKEIDTWAHVVYNNSIRWRALYNVSKIWEEEFFE